MQSLISQYIEISSEEEIEKASKWLESKGYECTHDKIYYKNRTYLFITSNNKFHFNHGNEKSYWKPFSILYDEGMPRDVLMGYRTAEITGSIGHIVRDEEDLLAKAKSLYPIGTQYKCAAGGYEVHTVESMDWYPSPPGHIYGEMSKGCIYKHGKWAEIVHEVKPVEKKEESKFEVGKWYKIEGIKNAYRKCSDVQDGRFYYMEYLTPIYGKNSAHTLLTAPLELLDLSEIQQYLPKGHPDLIVKPIEKWSVGSYVVFLTDEVKTNSGAEITKGKPYIINETLKKIKEGDLIFYCDSKYYFTEEFSQLYDPRRGME